jgi:hypothetical protein
MVNSEKLLDKIEKQIEYSTYLFLTTCLLTLYIIFSIYEKQKPIREFNTLKEYIRLYNGPTNSSVFIVKQKEVHDYIDTLTKRLDDSILKQLHYKIDWGMHTAYSNLNSLISPVKNNILINSETTINEILNALSAEIKVRNLKKIDCKTDRDVRLDSGRRTFYNVRDLHISDSGNKRNFNIKILIAHVQENNTLIFDEPRFNISCSCEIDTILLKSKNKFNWIGSNFPWLSKNLDQIGNNKFSSFNQIWEGKLTDEVLSEEQTIVGLKFRNYSMTIISIVLLTSIFVFHLSLLREIRELNSKLPQQFSLAILFKNKWASVLRVLIWIVIPVSSIVMSGYFISKDYIIMMWSLPILILGVIILREINRINRI